MFMSFWRCAWLRGAHWKCDSGIAAPSLDVEIQELFLPYAFVHGLIFFIIPFP